MNDKQALSEARKRWGKRATIRKVRRNKDGKPLLVVDPETNSPRPASFAEALNVLVPDTFRKPSGAKGSDATSDSVASAGTGNGSIKTKADLKNPVEKAKYISDHGLEAFQQLPSGAAK